MTGMSEAVRDAILASRAPATETILRWRAGPEVRALEAAFADCPADDPVPALARATHLLGDTGWAEALLAPLVEALAADPLFEPPLKPRRDGTRIGAILFDCPAAAITASVTRAAALRAAPAARTVLFSGRMTVTRYVRADGAVLRRWRVPPADAEFRAADALPCVEAPARMLADADVRTLDGRCEAQLLASAAHDVVTLTATLRAGAAPLIREHAVSDGRLLRVASADDRASRTEMLLAFLRLSGRADAGSRFEAATRDPAFHLRWAAMREWLALDARAALPRLEAMAGADPHAEVRAAAARTLAAVRARLEPACPA